MLIRPVFGRLGFVANVKPDCLNFESIGCENFWHRRESSDARPNQHRRDQKLIQLQTLQKAVRKECWFKTR
jgi:hypothetical protein